MIISKLYISLLADPEWPIEAVPLYTKKDFLAATKSDKGLTYKTTLIDLDNASNSGIECDKILDLATEIFLLEDTYPFEDEKTHLLLSWLGKLCNRNVANAIKIRDKINSDLNMLH